MIVEGVIALCCLDTGATSSFGYSSLFEMTQAGEALGFASFFTSGIGVVRPIYHWAGTPSSWIISVPVKHFRCRADGKELWHWNAKQTNRMDM
jgi:hypothetical protein